MTQAINIIIILELHMLWLCKILACKSYIATCTYNRTNLTACAYILYRPCISSRKVRKL